MNGQQNQSGRFPVARYLALSLALGFLTHVPTSASAQADAGEFNPVGLCSATAFSASTACLHDTQQNYWLARANCHNLSDRTARSQCAQASGAALGEGKEQCAAQREARLQICKTLGETPYDPRIDPAMFVDPAQIGKSVPPNRYFPLVAGRTWIYRSGTETTTVTVTGETKSILGVATAEVHDVVSDAGEVIEDTTDWYAQDINGNVWYFGEISQDFHEGELVAIDGSWKAGREGGKPGLLMKAAPMVGDEYRQEFSLANAEDMARVLSLAGTASVPAASCRANCMVSKEWTPLAPEDIEHKYYAPGVGFILGLDQATGRRLELVEVRN